jgi:hypothetical protein
MRVILEVHFEIALAHLQLERIAGSEGTPRLPLETALAKSLSDTPVERHMWVLWFQRFFRMSSVN